LTFVLNTFASLRGFAFARGLGNCFRPYCSFLSRCVSGACTTPSAAHRFSNPSPIFRVNRFLCGACSVWLIFSCRAIAWQKFTHYHLREVLYGEWDVRGFGTHAVHLQRWPMFMMIEWEVCNSSPGHRLPGKIVDGNYQRWELLEGRITKIWPAHGKCFYYECR